MRNVCDNGLEKWEYEMLMRFKKQITVTSRRSLEGDATPLVALDHILEILIFRVVPRLSRLSPPEMVECGGKDGSL